MSIGSTDRGIVSEILSLFIENLKDLEKAIKSPGVTESYWHSLAESAHRYKTPAMSVGSLILAAKLDELEDAIYSSQLQLAREVISELPRIISQTRGEIRDFLEM